LTTASKAQELRAQLVGIALEWEEHLGVAPAVTSIIGEWDSACIVGMTEAQYCADSKHGTAVSRGHDFEWCGIRYQVTASRPSGKPGSSVTLVSRKNEDKRDFQWDKLIWVHYDRYYVIQEAWE
jgi:hypothetical protein